MIVIIEEDFIKDSECIRELTENCNGSHKLRSTRVSISNSKSESMIVQPTLYKHEENNVIDQQLVR